jgi:hypothetical protein
MIQNLWQRLRRREPVKPRTVMLHVGASNTGTSAIQTWLARKQQRLEEHGISYPSPLGGLDSAIEGKITTGNAAKLGSRILQNGGRSVDTSPKFVSWLNRLLDHPADTILLSSEILQSCNEDGLSYLKTLFEKGGRQVRIIYVVRNIAYHFFSKWGQHVKGRGEYVSREEFSRKKVMKFPFFLDHSASVYGREFIQVINYESNKHDIVRPILALLTPAEFGDTLVERANRSLSARGMELMRAFNHAVAQGTKDASVRAGLTRGLSDFLIYGADLAPMKLTLTEPQFTFPNEKHGEVVDVLNRAYLLRQPIMVADPAAVSATALGEGLGREDRDLMRTLAERAVRGDVEFRSLSGDGDCLRALAEVVRTGGMTWRQGVERNRG